MEINVLNILEETCGSFGGKVWDDVKVLATVTPDKYELKTSVQVNKTTGDTFDSNQILISGSRPGTKIPVNIKSGEQISDEVVYDLVQFVALRDIEGSKFVKGSTTVKAVVNQAKTEAMTETGDVTAKAETE